MTGEECYKKECFVETAIESSVGLGLKVKTLSSKDVFLNILRIKKESLEDGEIFYQKIKEFFEDVTIIDGTVDPVSYEMAKSLLPKQFILIHCLCFEQKRIGLIVEKSDHPLELVEKSISIQEESDHCWNYFLSEATLWLATAGDIPKIIELIMPSLNRFFR